MILAACCYALTVGHSLRQTAVSSMTSLALILPLTLASALHAPPSAPVAPSPVPEKVVAHPAAPAKSTPKHATAAGALNELVVRRVPAHGATEELAVFTRADTSSIARLKDVRLKDVRLKDGRIKDSRIKDSHIKDGRIALAFQEFPADDPSAFNRAAVRFSDDDGRTWTEAARIVVDNLDASLAPPFDPTLVALPDGRVRLYFISFVARGLKPGTPPTATAVYSAVSTDGVRFAFEPGVRFAVEGRVVLDAAAALHDGVFHLVVPDNGTAAEFLERRAKGEPQPGGNGYHAVSKDGLVFERAADLPLPSSRNRWWGNLLSNGDSLLFFGTGPGPWPLVSKDGMRWSVAAKPVALTGVDPAVLPLRDDALLVVTTRETLEKPRPDSTPAASGAADPAHIPAPSSGARTPQAR